MRLKRLVRVLDLVFGVVIIIRKSRANRFQRRLDEIDERWLR